MSEETQTLAARIVSPFKLNGKTYRVSGEEAVDLDLTKGEFKELKALGLIAPPKDDEDDSEEPGTGTKTPPQPPADEPNTGAANEPSQPPAASSENTGDVASTKKGKAAT